MWNIRLLQREVCVCVCVRGDAVSNFQGMTRRVEGYCNIVLLVLQQKYIMSYIQSRRCPMYTHNYTGQLLSSSETITNIF